MSAEEEGSPARVGTRLRRLRAMPEMDDERPDGGARQVADDRAGSGRDYEPDEYRFGYGGWSVTIDRLEMPEPERTVVPVRSDGVSARARISPRRTDDVAGAAPEESGPLQEPPELPPAQTTSTAAAPDPDSQRQAAAAPDGRARRPSGNARESDDRPLIAPQQRRRGTSGDSARAASSPRRLRRRPRRESPARPEGARGVRKRRDQRIEGGGTVMIDDELYPLVDWSAGGIAIRSEQQSYRIGDRKKLELEIDLDDYAVNLDLEGEVVNRSSERTGWQFIAPTETQLEVLRALTRASLTGESFAAPFAASADPRSGASGLRSGSNPITAGLALALNLVIIALAAGAAVYHLSDGRMPGDLVAALTPAPAVRSDFAAVAVERLPLEADVAGAVVEWRAAPGDAVRAGEPLLVLLDEPAEQAPAAPETPAADVAEAPTTPGATTEDSGDATGDGTDAPEAVRTILTSPCDCTVLERSVEAGERVVAGETVGILTPETGTRVEALFATAAAPRPGDAVAVELPASGERLAGIVEEVNPSGEADATSLPRALLGADETVIARIRPTPALSPFLAGAPAIVTLAPDA